MSLVSWTMMDLGLAGQKELLLSKSRAMVAPGLCLLATPEEQQLWCLHEQIMAPWQIFPMSRDRGTLGKQTVKGLYKTHSSQ